MAAKRPAPVPTIPACGNCRFWLSTSTHRGECHALPPQIAGMKSVRAPQKFFIRIKVSISTFPTSGANQWCGKHEGRTHGH